MYRKRYFDTVKRIRHLDGTYLGSPRLSRSLRSRWICEACEADAGVSDPGRPEGWYKVNLHVGTDFPITICPNCLATLPKHEQLAFMLLGREELHLKNPPTTVEGWHIWQRPSDQWIFVYKDGEPYMSDTGYHLAWRPQSNRRALIQISALLAGRPRLWGRYEIEHTLLGRY